MMRLVFAESAGSSDAYSSFKVGIIFFVEVRKRGDLPKCGRFDHIRQRSDACRKQDLATAKRRSKLLVQPPDFSTRFFVSMSMCSLHSQRPGIGRSSMETALTVILTS
jgi:hypothetical protein